jgi:hypothetical protein
MFRFYLPKDLLCYARGVPTVGVSGWWAGWDSAWEQEKLEARKMPKNGTESHQSAARIVGWRAVVQDSLAVKEPARIQT